MTGVVGFAVWVHHLFAVGMSHGAKSFFSAASMRPRAAACAKLGAWIAASP